MSGPASAEVTISHEAVRRNEDEGMERETYRKGAVPVSRALPVSTIAELQAAHSALPSKLNSDSGVLKS